MSRILFVLALLLLPVVELGIPSGARASLGMSVDGGDDVRLGASLDAGSFSIEGRTQIFEKTTGMTPAAWQPAAPVTIDDCSVFLAMGSREDPQILDCVGEEIRAPGFEMPAGNYFLVSPTGEVIDVADIPVVVTLAEFRRLPIDGGTLAMQPAAAQVLINIETVAWSTGRTHILGTTILGTAVQVRATPIEWAWDFGGGTGAFATDTPGGPYPNLDVSRTYMRTAAGQDIDLTITWAGEYRVNGAGPWVPIAGTTTTSATSPAFDVVEAPARLVTGALGDG